MNADGTPHTRSEIQKVKDMISKLVEVLKEE